MAFPELPDDRRARPRRYRGSAEDGDPRIPDESPSELEEQDRLLGSASRHGGSAHRGARAGDERLPRRAAPPEGGGRRRARVDDPPEPPDEDPPWPPRGRRALREDRAAPPADDHAGAGRNGHHRNGGANGAGANGSAVNGSHTNGTPANGAARNGVPADRVRDAYPYTGSGPDATHDQGARARRHGRSEASEPVAPPTGRRHYRAEPDDDRADDRGPAPRRPQTNGYAAGPDDERPPPRRPDERPPRREGPPPGPPRGPANGAPVNGRPPVGPPGGPAYADPAPGRGPAPAGPPPAGPAPDGRTNGGPPNGAPVRGPVPGGPAPMNGAPAVDRRPGAPEPRRRHVAPEDVPPDGTAPPPRRRRAEPGAPAVDPDTADGDPGRTRRPPPARPGRESETAYVDPVPDEDDDVDTTALPTGPDRRTPRRRPGAARAPGRPVPPAEDVDDEPPDDRDGFDDEAAEDDGPRVGKRSGPVGIGGRIAALTSRRSGGTGEDGKKQTSFWRELPLLIGVALVLTFLIQTFVAKVFVIPSGSMETTLNGCTGCDNDRVLVDKVTYNFTDIAPGDVVVFRGPDSWSSSEYELDQTTNPVLRGLQMAGSLIGFAPPDEKDFVKRVIATGGQTVACCDALNQVMVDGQPLEEPYIYYLPEAGPARQIPFGPITVPQGEMWMMGDSRNNSADSRAAGHGPVPEENVIGKVRLIVLPFDRFGWVDAVNPQTSAQADAAGGLPQGAPLALGMMGAFPFALGRRRFLERRAEEQRFLPVVRRRKRWRPSS